MKPYKSHWKNVIQTAHQPGSYPVRKLLPESGSEEDNSRVNSFHSHPKSTHYGHKNLQYFFLLQTLGLSRYLALLLLDPPSLLRCLSLGQRPKFLSKVERQTRELNPFFPPVPLNEIPIPPRERTKPLLHGPHDHAVHSNPSHTHFSSH